MWYPIHMRLFHSLPAFAKTPAHTRAALLEKIAASIETDHASWAELICTEVHKPIRAAELEVTRAIQVFRWAAAECVRDGGSIIRLDAMATPTPPNGSSMGITRRFARGVVMGITPFNFPLNLVAHKVAPALATGSPILIKPSPFAVRTARKLCNLIESLHPGIIECAAVSDAEAAALTCTPEIATVSFTGSAAVGWKVREQASRKAVVLELGGNAWAICGEDVAPERMPEIAGRIARGAFAFAGQSCISVQNIALPRAHAAAWMQALITATESTAYGDPRDERVVCGPVIHEQAFRRIESAVAGRKVLARSKNPIGNYPHLIAPQLLELSDWDAAVVCEEIFGPVANVWVYDTLEEAVTRINSGRYGLQCGVFTDRWPTIHRLYEELQVGGLVVNDVPTTRYDHQPYGGMKDSGLGREGIRAAMDEYTEPRFLAL